MKNSIFLLLLVTFLFGCDSDDDNNPIFEPSPIEFTTLSKGTVIAEENITQNTVISTVEDFQQLITQMELYDPNLDMDIDFSQFSVVAVIGESHSSGSKIEITELTEYQDSVKVFTYESLYDNTVPSIPYHLVKIPVTPKPFVFYNSP